MRESRLRALHIFVSSEEFEAGYLSDIFVHSNWHYNKVGHVTIGHQDKKKKVDHGGECVGARSRKEQPASTR